MAQKNFARSYSIENKDVAAVAAIAEKFSVSRAHVVRVAIRRLAAEVEETGELSLQPNNGKERVQP